jgi:hypothetical protein
VATVVMTIAMNVMGDGGPHPTAVLVAKVAGGDPADHAMPGMEHDRDTMMLFATVHVIYGVVLGAVLGAGISPERISRAGRWEAFASAVLVSRHPPAGFIHWRCHHCLCCPV